MVTKEQRNKRPGDPSESLLLTSEKAAFCKNYSNNLDGVIISLTFSVRCASDARCLDPSAIISPPGASDLPVSTL